jgi:putative ABC transport system permease protein
MLVAVLIDVLLNDIRYTVRGFARGGIFTAVTILTLGLGIGVVTALFAVVSAVLLHPIVPDQHRVVRVSKLDTERGGFPYSLSLPEFRAWRDQSRSFESLAAVDHAATGAAPIAIDGQTSAVTLAPVSADFFRVLHRGQPRLGRWFQTADEDPGAEVVAVVSERFWLRVSGGDPAFLGRRLAWAGARTLLVVGIAPASVDYPLGTDIWVPAATVFDGAAGRFDAKSRTFSQFELLGRLAPGVSLNQVRAELTVIHRRVTEEFPDDYRFMPVVVEPLLDTVVGDSRQVLLVLFGAAGLVFVIAGVNVAALLLMRAWGRRTEIAVRVALGAGRMQLLRQTVIEGLVLGGSGSVCGVIVARLLLGVAQWLAPGDVPRIEQAALDLRVLGFCVVAALAWVLTLGTIPVWAHRRITGAPGVGGAVGGVSRTRGLILFTIAEIAAAVVVAIGAGLLVRTFTHLQGIDRGFNSNNLLAVSLLLPEGRQRDARALLAFYDQLLPRVEALPDVISASPTHMRPGTGTIGLSAPMLFEGQTAAEAKTNPWSTWEPVRPSYFRTLGIPIVRGRGFTAADRRDGAPVAIVSEAVARRYWPGQDPIGKRLQFVPTPEWPWVTVVGVVPDTRYRELTRSWMTVYLAADQFFYFQAATVVVRTASASGRLVPAIREVIGSLEPGATIESAETMDALLARELSRPLTAVAVTSLFALVSIVLAAVGVYGVMSYEVRQRRRELAVRSAIGATPADIFWSVVRRTFLVGATGAVAGLITAGAATQSLRSLLFEVQPIDPVAFLAGAVVLMAAVLLAACFPARRAASTDPAAGLRPE